MSPQSGQGMNRIFKRQPENQIVKVTRITRKTAAESKPPDGFASRGTAVLSSRRFPPGVRALLSWASDDLAPVILFR